MGVSGIPSLVPGWRARAPCTLGGEGRGGGRGGEGGGRGGEGGSPSLVARSNMCLLRPITSIKVTENRIELVKQFSRYTRTRKYVRELSVSA